MPKKTIVDARDLPVIEPKESDVPRHSEIYNEVLRGITESPDDNPSEREFRRRTAEEVAAMRARGEIPEVLDDL